MTKTTEGYWPTDKVTLRRLHFVDIIDAKNPMGCRVDLVMWAMGLKEKKDVQLNRCTDNRRPCYCGKFQ